MIQEILYITIKTNKSYYIDKSLYIDEIHWIEQSLLKTILSHLSSLTTHFTSKDK